MSSSITITDAVTLSDGGTKYLIGYDNNAKEINILVAQHIFPDNFDLRQVPGRLHFNNKPISVRSKTESEIVRSLERCSIKIESTELAFSTISKDIVDSENLIEAIEKGQSYGIAYLVKHIIDYIQSDSYIEIAAKVRINT